MVVGGLIKELATTAVLVSRVLEKVSVWGWGIRLCSHGYEIEGFHRLPFSV